MYFIENSGEYYLSQFLPPFKYDLRQVVRVVIQKLTSEHTSYRLVSRLSSEFQDGKNAFKKKLGKI